MLKIHLSALALAGVCLTSTSSAGIFADAVESYTPGVGYATGYTNAAAALNQPNRDTAFGAVTPFNPPFSSAEMVSLGANGLLTVSFLTPIQNNPANPFGLDFVIYGSAGFVDFRYPNNQTDGNPSIFSENTGQTRVWVSPGGGLFYQLNPLFAPTVDGPYPTDGSGTFGVPVNPALGLGNFADKSLAEIRVSKLYEHRRRKRLADVELDLESSRNYGQNCRRSGFASRSPTSDGTFCRRYFGLLAG